MTIWRMRVGCWISKNPRSQARAHVLATHTHARTNSQKYLVLIAFPQQECIRERASVLRHTYIACLVV
jgi:hypothetical protein